MLSGARLLAGSGQVSECHGETEEGDRRGGKMGQAEVVTAVDGQTVVDRPDAADTRHDGGGASRPRLVQFLQLEAPLMRGLPTGCSRGSKVTDSEQGSRLRPGTFA